MLDDLKPGQTYTFKIKSTNMVGDSPFSNQYTFLMVDAPSQPLDL